MPIFKKWFNNLSYQKTKKEIAFRKWLGNLFYQKPALLPPLEAKLDFITVNTYQDQIANVIEDKLKEEVAHKTKKGKYSYLKMKKAKETIRVRRTPDYPMFNFFFEHYPTIATCVYKISTNILNSGIVIKDFNGFENEIVKRDFENNFGSLKNAVIDYTIQLLVHGQVVDSKYKLDLIDDDDSKFSFRIIPCQETRDYYIDPNERPNRQITKLSWHNNNVVSNQELEQFDDKERLFYVTKLPTNTPFLGPSPIQSLLVDMDTIFKNNTLYQIQLANGLSKFTIAVVADRSYLDSAESVIRQMRDSSSRGKIPVIEGINSGGNIISPVQFQTIDGNLDKMLTIDEKVYVDKKVSALLGVPYILIDSTKGGGLNSDIYSNALEELAITAKYYASFIEDGLNNFRIKEGLKEMEDQGYFAEKFESGEIFIKEGKTKRPATAEDFTLSINQMGSLTTSQKFDYGIKIVSNENAMSIFTSKEIKQRFFGYEEEDVNVKDDLEEEIANQGVESSQQEELTNESEEAKTKAKKTLNDELEAEYDRELVSKQLTRAEEFSKVPALLKLQKTQEFKKKISNALKKQAKVNKKILKLVDKKKIQKTVDPNDEKAVEQLANQIQITKFKNLFDKSSFEKDIQEFGSLGIDQVETFYERNFDQKLTSKQRDEINKEIKDWVKERTKNLFDGKPKNATITEELTNPYFDGSLDQTTLNDIARITLSTIKQNPNIADKELIKIIQEKIDKRILERTDLIVADNISKIFSLGLYYTGLKTNAKQKKWLRTTSLDPREKHLDTVGEVVDYDKSFSNGEFWSQTLINCECSIQIVW